MSVPHDVLALDRGLTDWCILHAYRGSIAHGMWEPNTEPGSIDDKDTMAICVPPPEILHGIGRFPSADDGHGPYFAVYGDQGTVEIVRDPWDIVIYEVRKAMYLLMVGNPNMLSILWLPRNLYILRTDAGQMLLDSRELFVGRHVYRSFVGYATDQLYKMEHASTRGYMGEKRKALVEKYGYDTKNAAHLIRLLRMGIEFLRDGELNVDRGGYDATELLAIKHGEWPLERVKAEAVRLFKRAEEVYDRSTLPPRPDHEKVNRLCLELVRAKVDEGSYNEPQPEPSL